MCISDRPNDRGRRRRARVPHLPRRGRVREYILSHSSLFLRSKAAHINAYAVSRLKAHAHQFPSQTAHRALRVRRLDQTCPFKLPPRVAPPLRVRAAQARPNLRRVPAAIPFKDERPRRVELVLRQELLGGRVPQRLLWRPPPSDGDAMRRFAHPRRPMAPHCYRITVMSMAGPAPNGDARIPAVAAPFTI